MGKKILQQYSQKNSCFFSVFEKTFHCVQESPPHLTPPNLDYYHRVPIRNQNIKGLLFKNFVDWVYNQIWLDLL